MVKQENAVQENVGGHWLVSSAVLDDQQKYIAALRPEESYMVEGCAGSGKSVLAMIKFNQLCGNGAKPVYATMMRGLTDTIISEVLQSGDEGMEAARKYIRSNTRRLTSPSDHGKAWFYSSTSVGTCAMLACINPQARYCLSGDSLVLDECQDLSYKDFLKIVEGGGYKSICWYGDDDQQLCDNLDGDVRHVRMHEIFEKCFNEDGENEKWYKLTWNYRISRNVAKFIDEFQKIVPEERKMLAFSARGRHTDKPYLCGYETLEREINSVVEVIKNRKWYEPNGHSTAILIGGTNRQVEEMYTLISRKLQNTCVGRVDIQRRHGPTVRDGNDWVTADPGAPIIVSTPLQSKGCQFDSVFVLANTFGTNEGRVLSAKDLNGIHVAMTRSGGELFVFYVGSIPPAFDQIPLALYEKSLTVTNTTAEDLGLD